MSTDYLLKDSIENDTKENRIDLMIVVSTCIIFIGLLSCLLYTSDKQLEERIKELEKLKNKNIEDEELTYLYEKAYRIFEESIGQRREMVQQILYKLDDAKKSGKVGQMKKIKVIVENMLDNIDTQSPFDFEDNELLN